LGVTYPSKKAADAFACDQIANCHKADRQEWLNSFVRNHPRFDQKVPHGVPFGFYHRQRDNTLMLTFEDRPWVEISWKKCVKPSFENKTVSSALRKVAKETDTCPVGTICVLCSKPITALDKLRGHHNHVLGPHLHHNGKSFATVVEDFFKYAEIDRSSVKVTYSGEIENQAIVEAFRYWHDDQADLRWTHSACNLREGRQDG